MTFHEKVPEALVATILSGADVSTLLQAYRENFIFDLAFEEDIKWQVNHDYGWLYESVQKKLFCRIHNMHQEELPKLYSRHRLFQN